MMIVFIANEELMSASAEIRNEVAELQKTVTFFYSQLKEREKEIDTLKSHIIGKPICFYMCCS